MYQNKLTRAVIISLFTWRRAEPDDDIDFPFGWWGDSYPTVQNDRIGSRLYLLKRSTLTNRTAPKAKEYISEALKWMVDDDIASRIDVEVNRTAIDTLKAKVIITLTDGTVKSLTFDNIWSEINAK